LVSELDFATQKSMVSKPTRRIESMAETLGWVKASPEDRGAAIATTLFKR
jgi:hypothetical protein